MRVWSSEPLLAELLLRENAGRARRALELGGGMTALAGLALAASGLCTDVTLSDGHPVCVANQEVCLRLCLQHDCFPEGVVRTRRLHWAEDAGEGGRFDLVFAADCLFFTDYHEALLALLERVLAVDGRVLLLQPRRGDSMEAFVRLAASSPSLLVEVSENFSEDLHNKHSQTQGYDPDIHRPVLVTLRRRRGVEDTSARYVEDDVPM